MGVGALAGARAPRQTPSSVEGGQVRPLDHVRARGAPRCRRGRGGWRAGRDCGEAPSAHRRRGSNRQPVSAVGAWRLGGTHRSCAAPSLCDETLPDTAGTPADVPRKSGVGGSGDGAGTWGGAVGKHSVRGVSPVPALARNSARPETARGPKQRSARNSARPETARGPKQGPVTRRHRTYAVGLGVCVRGEGSVVLGALDRGELVVARTLLGRQRLPPRGERRLRLRRRRLGRSRPGRARSLLALRHVHEERVRTPRVRRRVRVLLRPPAVGPLPRRRRQCRRPVAVLVRRARCRCLRRRRCSSRWACRSRLRWRAQQQSRVHLQAPRNPVRPSETQVTSLRPVLERWVPQPSPPASRSSPWSCGSLSTGRFYSDSIADL